MALLLCAVGVAACYAIPARLAFGGGWYAFAYSSDEMAYTQRVDLPPKRASANNVFNSVSDPDVISPYFLDGIFRGILRTTGMSVVALFWLWRALFPFLLLLAYYTLARQCLSRNRTQRPLAWICAALSLGLTYVLYHIIVDGMTTYYFDRAYVPIFMLLNRALVNIEFALGIVFSAAFVAWSRRPSAREGIVLCVVAMGTLYLRPYLAIPEIAAVFMAVLLYVFMQRLSPTALAAPAAAFALLLAPWIALDYHNQQCPGFRDQMQRMFLLPFPYQIHPLWWVFILVAAAILVCALRIRNPARNALIACAASLALLPFYAGLTPVAREMLANDRYSCFYLPVLISAFLLLANEWRRRQIGRGADRRIRLQRACAAAAFAAAAIVLWLSASFEFERPFYPSFMEREPRCFAAYDWIRTHTPEDALFLVDDGYDRSRLGGGDAANTLAMTQLSFFHFDLFGMLARRQRVYADLMYVYPVREQDLQDMLRVHWGTFGARLPGFTAALKRFPPQYILWRKFPPIFEADRKLPAPRGVYGHLLQRFAQTVYTDNYCEIWRMDYTHAQPPAAGDGDETEETSGARKD